MWNIWTNICSEIIHIRNAFEGSHQWDKQKSISALFALMPIALQDTCLAATDWSVNIAIIIIIIFIIIIIIISLLLDSQNHYRKHRHHRRHKHAAWILIWLVFGHQVKSHTVFCVNNRIKRLLCPCFFLQRIYSQLCSGLFAPASEWVGRVGWNTGWLGPHRRSILSLYIVYLMLPYTCI